MDEKRKSVRKYLYNYSQVLDNKNNRIAGRLVNITPEGMMIMSDEPIEQNEKFEFKINLPLGMMAIATDNSIEFKGNCRWCRESYNPDYYDVGFEFTDIPEASKNTIDYLMKFHSFNY
jgi:hypothetical protein